MNKFIIKLNKDCDAKDISDIFTSIFEEKSLFAKYKTAYFKNICEKFEKKYSINSSDFLSKFENGEIGDEQDFFDWYSAKKGLDIWTRKLSILTGVTISDN